MLGDEGGVLEAEFATVARGFARGTRVVTVVEDCTVDEVVAADVENKHWGLIFAGEVSGSDLQRGGVLYIYLFCNNSHAKIRRRVAML